MRHLVRRAQGPASPGRTYVRLGAPAHGCGGPLGRPRADRPAAGSDEPDWPQAGGNAANAMYNLQVGPNRPSRLASEYWLRHREPPPGIASPVVAAGRVFTVIRGTSRLLSMPAPVSASGGLTSLVMRTMTTTSWPGGIAYDGGRVFVSNAGFGKVIAPDAGSGKLVWARPSGCRCTRRQPWPAAACS